MPKMPIDSQKERFELVFSQNRRIVFSAPYGAGKSYFINEFFKEKKGWQNIVIHPLNYQTCGNDDVFQLLQRDVLVTLCANNPDIINNTKDQKLGAIVRAAHVFFDNLSADSSFASNIAPPLLIKSIYALKKLKEVFTTDELSEACGEYGTVQGEIKETNPLSELICYYIERLHNHGKHICLTIDDFDRMDPGQIFRLLNVFSTCVYDNEDNANRFGLDKIILVCDIDNIKKIYHHLYGDADFHSYISKFAPIQPFRYSIVEEYPAYISDLMGEAFCKNYPSVSKLLSERIVSSTSDIRAFENKIPRKKISVEDSIEVLIYPQFFNKNPYFNPNEHDFIHFVSVCKQFEIDGKELITQVISSDEFGAQEIEVINLMGLLIMSIHNNVKLIKTQETKTGAIYYLNLHKGGKESTECNCILNPNFNVQDLSPNDYLPLATIKEIAILAYDKIFSFLA